MESLCDFEPLERSDLDNYELAAKRYQNGDLLMAQEICSHLITGDECHAAALHLMGHIERTRGNVHSAIDYLTKAVANDPRRPGLLVDLGDAFVETLRFGDAIGAYGRAQKLLGEELVVFEKLANAYLGQGDICAAIDALGQGFACGVEDRVIAVMNMRHQKPEIVAIKNRCDALLEIAASIGVCPLKIVEGWYVPRSDIATPISLLGAPLHKGRPVCDLEHVKFCITKLNSYRRALDIGANIGCWSWVLSDYFQYVDAFEPMPMLQRSFTANLVKDNIRLHEFALGANSSLAEMNFMHMATGGSFITSTVSQESVDQNNSNNQFVVKRLDDLNFQDVDFMKIDTEGFEAFVVRGALETITRCKPIIYVEQIWGARYNEGGQHDAVRMLLGVGARATPLGDGCNFLIEWP